MEEHQFIDRYREEVLSEITLPERISRDYILEDCLKRTGERKVYRIKSRANGASYILKEAPYTQRQLLLKEYTMSMHIHHSCIPKAMDILDCDDATYLIREYVEGDSLGAIVENRGSYDEEEAIGIGLALCDIFQYLHSLNPPVIHRDIKPQNIIATDDGRYMLIDLETSRVYKEDEGEDTVYMGTKRVAAPEQFGYQQTDARADIYGLGMLLVYLVMGNYSIEAGQMHKMSSGFMKIIKRCLAFDPKKRYPSVAVLSKRLRGCEQKSALWKGGLIGIASLLILATILLWGILGKSSSRQAEAIIFREPLIEKAVRMELQIDDKTPIYKADLDKVTQILICGEAILTDWNRHRQYCNMHYINDQVNDSKGSINSLEDLRQMKGIKRLILDNQNIRDIGFLKGLPLERLSISGNQIENLNPLESCEDLRHLWMESNEVKDIDVLSQLTKLSVLNLNYNPILTIKSLEALPLEKLYMNDTLVDDFAILRELPLTLLCVSGLTDKGCDIVGAMTDLRELTIYNSRLEAIDPFLQLTELRYLDIFSNEITHIRDIKTLENLEHLGMGENDIRDITEITGLRYLKSIDINGCPIDDLTPLNQVSNLDYVFCDQDKVVPLQELFGDRPVHVVSQQ